MKGRAGWRRGLAEYAGVLVGVTLTALALDLFLIPNRIAAGGVSGLATVIFYVAGLPVGATMLVLNVPLFAASVRVLGLHFGFKTVFGFVTLSLLVDLVAPFVRPLTADPLLASLYGGALAGVGIGLTFRFGGSTGGTDLAARLLARYTPLSVGQSLLAVDGLVIGAAGIAFNPELALLALLAVFLTARTIDLVEEGRPYAKAALIVSDRTDAIAAGVLQELDRGVTALHGRGMYTGRDREILFVVLGRVQIPALKRLVARIDPDAFVVIADVHEALGEGFKRP